jgi:hypothetical protein
MKKNTILKRLKPAMLNYICLKTKNRGNSKENELNTTYLRREVSQHLELPV